ncbi:MAG: hypothetical protein FJ303_01505 [Planctomycetes bacterium]|nr:hypothetical protein [Planctomycetota bacterium]
MKSSTFSLAVLLAWGAGSAVCAQEVEMNVHVIRDKMVNNKVAVTFLKPKGWTVTGGIQWYPNLSHQACVEVKVANPDGLE